MPKHNMYYIGPLEGLSQLLLTRAATNGGYGGYIVCLHGKIVLFRLGPPKQ